MPQYTNQRILKADALAVALDQRVAPGKLGGDQLLRQKQACPQFVTGLSVGFELRAPDASDKAVHP